MLFSTASSLSISRFVFWKLKTLPGAPTWFIIFFWSILCLTYNFHQTIKQRLLKRMIITFLNKTCNEWKNERSYFLCIILKGGFSKIGGPLSKQNLSGCNASRITVRWWLCSSGKQFSFSSSLIKFWSAIQIRGTGKVQIPKWGERQKRDEFPEEKYNYCRGGQIVPFLLLLGH